MRIDQLFPRCARCGRMIFTDAPRIEMRRGRPLKVTTLCTELCRNEYIELHGLDDRGSWRTPASAKEKIQ